MSDPVVDQVARSFELTRLTERLERVTAENASLREECAARTADLDTHKTNHSDIVRTLQDSLASHAATIRKQDASIKELTLANTTQKNHFNEFRELTALEWQQKWDALVSHNTDLQNKLDTVQEFLSQKSVMDSKIQELRDQIDQMKEQQQRELSDEERKKALALESLKMELTQRFKEREDSMRLKTKEAVNETAKRTLLENEQMSHELRYQSRETERLISLQEGLEDQTVLLRRELSLHKHVEAELARRTQAYQKLVRKLKNRLKAIPSSYITSPDQSPGVKEKDGGADVRGSLINSSTRSDLDLDPDPLEEELASVKAELQEARSLLEQYCQKHVSILQVEDQVARLLIKVILQLHEEAKNGKLMDSLLDDELEETEFGKLDDKQRLCFCATLLDRLNRALCPDCLHSHSTLQFIASDPFNADASLKGIDFPERRAADPRRRAAPRASGGSGPFTRWVVTIAQGEAVEPPESPRKSNGQQRSTGVQTTDCTAASWNPATQKKFTLQELEMLTAAPSPRGPQRPSRTRHPSKPRTCKLPVLALT